MRWVRRVTLVSGVLALMSGGLQFALGRPVLGGVLIVVSALGVLSDFSLRRVIRRMEERGPPTDEARERGKRRARRFLWIAVPSWVALGAGIGWVINGAPAAIFMAVMVSSSSGLGIWLTRRHL
jgi:hypothetical protein